MRFLKILLVPAGLAIAPAASMAAPTTPGGNAPDEVRTGIDVTPAYHRGGYYHDRYYYRPYRRHWGWPGYGYRYYYGPPRHYYRYRHYYYY
jgi:hypothetical protein